MFDKAFSTVLSSNKRSASSERISLFDGFLALGATNTGARTSTSNYKTSLKLAAVYNAVEQISNDIAKIPFGVFKNDNGNRIADTSHYAHLLLSSQPNPYMTPFIWKKTMMTSLLMRGNAISVMNSNAAGTPISLDYVDWGDVQDILKKDGVLLYKIKGYANMLLSSEVIHWKQFSHNGIVGVSVITYAAQQLNMAIEVQEFSATNFENKGIRQGVVETEKAITAAGAKTKIAAAIKSAFSEKDATRVAVLDEGMTWKAITITPQEAQIVEMSRFTIEDIARWFNIAPHKIKSLQQSTNNNIEQQSLDHISDTIMPYVNNAEQEFGMKLLTSTDKLNRFIKGNMNVLLRSDIAARSNYYSKAINFGWMHRNEVRKLEDMNDGPEMLNEYLTPVNTYTEEQLAKILKENPNGN
jgi:HK97 family phage portal protein